MTMAEQARRLAAERSYSTASAQQRRAIRGYVARTLDMDPAAVYAALKRRSATGRPRKHPRCPHCGAAISPPKQEASSP